MSRRRFLHAALGAAAPLGLGACRSATATTDDGRTSAPAAPTGAAPASTAAQPTRTTAEVEQAIARFLADPQANGAALLALDMGATGDVGWVPFLLDLLRLSGDDLAAGQIMGVLQRLTGRYVLDDVGVALVTYGGWWLAQGTTPAPGLRRWREAFYGRVDAEIGRLLGTIDDAGLLSELFWAGPRATAMASLDRPGRVAVASADTAYLLDDDVVFGLVLGGTAVAYPERILGFHVVANDVLDGMEVAVSYCPLTRSARAVSAGGLRLRNSGLVRNANTVLRAADGPGLWQQLTGEALAEDGASGPARLAAVPLIIASWDEWRRYRPDSEVLARPDPAAGPDNPYASGPDGVYAGYRVDSASWFPIVEPPDAVALKATVAALPIHAGPSTTAPAKGQAAALAIDTVELARRGPSVIDRPAGSPARVLAVPDAIGARLYDATGSDLRAGRAVTVVRHDLETAVLADGRTLAAVPADRMTWFAWYGEHRSTDRWPGP